MFIDKQQFENFRISAEQKLLAVETFTDYKKSLEVRLKSIEEKLTHRYSLLIINRHEKNGNTESKSYFNLDAIIRAVKNQWLKPIIFCLSIGILALHLLHSITHKTKLFR